MSAALDGFAFALGALAALAMVAAGAAVAVAIWRRLRYSRIGWWAWRTAVGTTRRPSSMPWHRS